MSSTSLDILNTRLRDELKDAHRETGVWRDQVVRLKTDLSEARAARDEKIVEGVALREEKEAESAAFRVEVMRLRAENEVLRQVHQRLLQDGTGTSTRRVHPVHSIVHGHTKGEDVEPLIPIEVIEISEDEEGQPPETLVRERTELSYKTPSLLLPLPPLPQASSSRTKRSTLSARGDVDGEASSHSPLQKCQKTQEHERHAHGSLEVHELLPPDGRIRGCVERADHFHQPSHVQGGNTEPLVQFSADEANTAPQDTRAQGSVQGGEEALLSGGPLIGNQAATLFPSPQPEESHHVPLPHRQRRHPLGHSHRHPLLNPNSPQTSSESEDDSCLSRDHSDSDSTYIPANDSILMLSGLKRRIFHYPAFVMPAQDTPLASTFVSRPFLSEMFGGSASDSLVMHLNLDPDQIVIPSGESHPWLFPGKLENLALPHAPGEHGSILTAREDLGGLLDVSSKLWIPSRRENEKLQLWAYCGEYKITRSDKPVTGEEYRLLPTKTQSHWQKAILHPKKHNYASILARIWLHKHGCPVYSDIVEAQAEILRHGVFSSTGLKAEDVAQGFRSGTEWLDVLMLRCVGYDHNFAQDVQTRWEKYQAEH